jgi:drug/metabolite transporter (DMT)-like permease
MVRAVPVNYLVCVLLGLLLTSSGEGWTAFHPKPWWRFSALQGLCLAGNFYLLGHTARTAGVAVAALASRLSVAIPVILGVVLYGDRLGVLKAFGLTAAGASLFLFSIHPEGLATDRSLRRIGLPIIVFLAFGCHFSLLKYVQHFHLDPREHNTYVMSSFFFALVVSLGILFFSRRPSESPPHARQAAAGLLLGICNYSALFSLTRLLSLDRWESSVVFPTYSIGVVIVSSLAAAVLFGERLKAIQLAGMGMGLAAVGLLNG